MNALSSTPIARATVRERGFQPVTVVAILVLTLLALFRANVDLNGAEAFGGFSAAWYVLLTLYLGAALLSSEVESGHAQLLLLRPITRAQFVGGRLLGAAVVLTTATLVAWLVNQGAAIARGEFHDAALRAAVLPFALIPALGWLATLAALSAILPGWTNVAVLVGAKVGWTLLKVALPLLTRRPELIAAAEVIDAHFGPQDLLRYEGPDGPLRWSMLLWDLAWISGGWLVAVVLFRGRELARRCT